MSNLARSYDSVAEAYAQKFAGELEHKPFDTELLNQFAGLVRGQGQVYDMGCGPGQTTRYLHERGVDVSGIDMAPVMVAQATALHPGIEFQVGDMGALAAADEILAGIVAFYAIIHVERTEVTAVLAEWKRLLQPGGWLLFSFHVGSHTLHLDEWWQKPVSLDFHFFERAEMEGYLHAAGLDVVSVQERGPYPEVEAQTQRAYIFARKPV